MKNNNTDFLNPESGYTYNDLFDPFRLKNLAEDFYKYYEKRDAEKFKSFSKYRDSNGEGLSNQELSEILITSSVILNDFIIDLFCLESEQQEIINETESEKKILGFKNILQKKILKKFKAVDISEADWTELNTFAENIMKAVLHDNEFSMNGGKDEEKQTANMFLELIEIEKNYRWFYEGDKFAPDNFTIPDDIKFRAENILSSLKSAGIEELINAGENSSDLHVFKYVLNKLEKWIFAKKYFDEGVRKWISFSEPEKLDFSHLVKFVNPDESMPELMQGPEENYRARLGFKLTDKRMNKRQVLNEVDYCMYCHDRNKDSCSKGLSDRFGNKKINPVGIDLNGCPLEEKISEMQYVRKMGLPVASLALVMIDNPNVPGTGHRICNDCMKSCIFQTQEPVNIPEVETGVLTDIFKLPYGYEIYSLLSRWNPLNIKRPYPLPYNGKNILVVGMGPAGYTVSHYLLNEGFGVVGIDALKIEKVHQKYCGTKDENGFTEFPKPVKYFYQEIEEDLDKRILQGFGGVSEYGITVRWDKNFLTAIYINLSRRSHFRLYDGVRFGGTLTIDDAWKLGFDHIAIATGAGKPTIIRMKNNLIRGIKKASDFLMALQLTGAAKENNLANLQIQLPAVVIGGGLTAIDTATELLAYYPVQVLKALDKYEKLSGVMGEENFWKMYDSEEKEIMNTFIKHGQEIREELRLAEKEKRKFNILSLEKKWGGVTIAYRKRMIDSPAYRLNHEEIIKGFEEGISFAENLAPVEAVSDGYGAVKEMVFERQKKAVNDDNSKSVKYINSGEFITMKAKCVMVAAGTSPNIIYEKEYPGTFELDENKYFFKPYVFKDNKLSEAGKDETGFFTSYELNGKYISYYGDNHPKYAGNVVKALASAKDGYEKVAELFENEITGLNYEAEFQNLREENYRKIISQLDSGLIATVEDVIRLTPSIIEVVIRAPFAVEKFHPGQFYRLQNYETTARHLNGNVLTMEGLAMTGSLTDTQKGLLSVIVLEMGVSSRLAAFLRKGERVVIMGPTGAPTTIPKGENVMLAGGGLGNAVLFSIADALKKNGNRIIYFAGYKNSLDVYKMDEVESGTDQVIWSNDTGKTITPRREQDLTFTGNIIQSMIAYDNGELGEKTIDLKEVDRIIVIGSDRMMKAVKEARYDSLKDHLKEHVAIGSINSSMQCMMKEICAQCLQKHTDPESGKESFVFSCFNQDQLLDKVDFDNLNQRLRSNSVLEKLSNYFLTYLLSENNFGKQDFNVKERSESILEGH